MPLETYFPPIQAGGALDISDVERHIRFRAYQQQPVIYIAASNTPENLRYMAQYKCDGVDDTEELEAARQELDDVGEFFRGEIVLLPGTFNMTAGQSIVDSRGHRWRGSGLYATTLEVDPTHTGDLFNLNSVGSEISDMYIWAQGADIGGSSDALITFVGASLRNIWIEELDGGSPMIVSGTSGTIVDNINVFDCQTIDDITFGGDTKVTRSRFDTNQSGCDIQLNNGASMLSSEVIDCSRVIVSSDSRLIGNHIMDSSGVGVEIQGDDTIIANNIIESCGSHGISGTSGVRGLIQVDRDNW